MPMQMKEETDPLSFSLLSTSFFYNGLFSGTAWHTGSTVTGAVQSPRQTDRINYFLVITIHEIYISADLTCTVSSK